MNFISCVKAGITNTISGGTCHPGNILAIACRKHRSQLPQRSQAAFGGGQRKFLRKTLKKLISKKFLSSFQQIRLDASTIIMPNLRTVQAPSSSSSGSSRDHSSSGSSSTASSSSSHSKIYQLCACSNGKLFLAPAHSICTADDSAICR